MSADTFALGAAPYLTEFSMSVEPPRFYLDGALSSPEPGLSSCAGQVTSASLSDHEEDLRSNKRRRVTAPSHRDVSEPSTPRSGHVRNAFAALRQGLQDLQQEFDSQERGLDGLRFELEDTRTEIRSLKDELLTTRKELKLYKLNTASKLGEQELQLIALDKCKQDARVAIRLTSTYRELLVHERAESVRLRMELKAKDVLPVEHAQKLPAASTTQKSAIKDGELPKVNLIRAMHDTQRQGDEKVLSASFNADTKRQTNFAAGRSDSLHGGDGFMEIARPTGCGNTF
ncbi:uncharacterized protein EKO05_0006761 [Ascochyta rabiei]|uniref:Uncharacterized protein n=1 Tax=Didymella rabiei TaxID=5454 RepID=A0A163LLS3_DIDRA|nr:uncharacterized protein EKO05_0006761 [Ascochyta rabiei]KZM27907.1 hypothetical protein ST47_g944 [Ascochyta rabiei]UPX16353.1 hypothetical protein EKO05_0006761 [Ascochyta rabiei]